MTTLTQTKGNDRLNMKGSATRAVSSVGADPLVAPRPLPTTFIKNGFTYEQVLRDVQYAIYKQRLSPGLGCLAFEVFKVEVRPEQEAFGKVLPMREAGPSNEAFGFTAWSYPDLPRAKAKLKEVIDGSDEKRRRKG